jgi:DNA-binding transcriptional ArsR family regulator
MDAQNELPEVYYLETVDQLRTIADTLRQSILQLLIARPLTVTQVGRQLGIPPARAHYHVRELERVGLVRLVERRERGGILEKYYRAVACDLRVPPSILQGMSLEEQLSTVNDLLARVFADASAAVSRLQPGEGEKSFSLGMLQLFLQPDQIEEVDQKIQETLAPYGRPRGAGEEQAYSFAHLIYRPPHTGSGGESDRAAEGGAEEV